MIASEKELIEHLRNGETVPRSSWAVDAVVAVFATVVAGVLAWLLIWGTPPQFSAEHDLAEMEAR